MKLIFVRHGEPRKEDYNLTEKGVKQVELLGEYLAKEDISKMYMGTFGRSIYTGEILNKHLNIEIENKDWLNEFKHLVNVSDNEQQFPWEIDPKLWINDREALSFTEVFEHKIYGSLQLKEKCENVWNNFDKILKSYGYDRNDNIYQVTALNKDTIIISSHFATISVILSHLLNVPLYVTLHMFWIAPSSYVKLVSQETEKGEAIFRCCEYGSLSHLTNNESLKSYYGLQSETK